jgi:hypothetical protein
MNRIDIEEQIKIKEARLKMYHDREAEMLTGGVQSYGIGSRNLTRYQTDLSNIRAAIKELEEEIRYLKTKAEGCSVRKAVGVIPRDW